MYVFREEMNLVDCGGNPPKAKEKCGKECRCRAGDKQFSTLKKIREGSSKLIMNELSPLDG
jgi:hypothetical protein